jgi:hypothetical protein
VTSSTPKTGAHGWRRARAVAGAVAVLAIAVGAGLVSTAGAERAKVLGKSKTTPRPNCSGDSPDECQITGQVTGFQRAINGDANKFKAPAAGRIVAWSIDLAKPSKDERNIFGEAAKTNEFGTSPTAGVGILRKTGKSEFKLLRATPILEVQRYYGSQPIFTLEHSLRVRKGDIVALTTATWLPAFSIKHQGPDDVWVASRVKKNCEIPASVPAEDRLAYFFAHTRPHRDVGSTRKYQCAYDSARILYWAYFSPRD